LVAGVALGFGLVGTQPAIVLGTLAAVVAIAAAIYSPALGLAVLAFSYPFDLTTYAGPVKLTTSEALLLILALVLIGRHFLRHPPPVIRTSLDVPVLVFALATVVSVLGLTGFYSDQIVALIKAAGGFLLFFVATQSLQQRRDVWVVIGAVVAAGLLVAAQTIIPVLGSGSISILDRATGNLIDPNLFAGYLVLLVPLTLAIGLAARWKWSPIPTAGALLLLGATLVATLSRGGWLGLIVGIGTLAVLLPGRRRVIGGVAAAAVALLLLAAAGPVAARLGGGAGASPMQTLIDRFPIWTAALNMFVQHPIFGLGVDNFGNYIGLYDPSLDVNQAHDLFLNIAVERGLIGLMTFLALIILTFRTLLMTLVKLSGTDRLLVAAATASLAGFLADSLFDVAYYDYKILLLFWLIIGIGASLPRLLMNPKIA
jgi:O-antigen ligase